MKSVGEESFKKLVEESADGVLVVDQAGSIRFANPAACQFFGRERADLLGRQFGYPAVADEAVEIQVVLESGEPSVAELRVVEVVLQGEPAYLMNLRDVTLRWQQQQEIESLNRMQETILEVQRLILQRQSLDGILGHVCRLLIERHGCLAASVLTESNGQVVVAQKAAQPHLSAEEEVAWGELPACCKAGLELPFEFGALSEGCVRGAAEAQHRADGGQCFWNGRHAVRIERENVVFGLLVVRTGSEPSPYLERLLAQLANELGREIKSRRVERARKETESELRKSEERFRALFANSIDGIIIANDDGDYLDANSAASRLFAMTRGELLDINVASLEVPDGETAAQQFQRYRQGQNEIGRFRFLNGDGVEKLVEYSAFPLGGDRHASVLRDVTEREALQDQLLHAQKMQALGRLAGGVAHDFNNLLTAMLSFAGFAQEDLAEDDPRRDDLNEVLRAGRSAARLTESLMAFAKRAPRAPRPVQVEAVIRDLKKMMSRLLGKDVKLVTREDTGLEPVLMDRGQLEQVIVNLAVNARDAMPQGGTLSFHTSVEESDPVLGRCVSIKVSDTGEGMTQEVKQHLFEPFFTTKSERKGTGLGLSTVYAIVDAAGGRILLESQRGVGTTFKLRFPIHDDEVTELQQVTPGEQTDWSSAGGRILVVEDEGAIRRVTKRILSDEGFEVFLASNGRNALALLDETAVDLVLCDVVMPEMNGPETIREIVKRWPDTALLMMTGYADEHSGMVELQEDNLAPQLIRKPFDRKTLLQGISRALRSAGTNQGSSSSG